MDFSQLSLPKVAKAPTDPFKIIGALPRLGGVRMIFGEAKQKR